jgi:3-hydroxyacyl-CoA dehydrogenase
MPVTRTNSKRRLSGNATALLRGSNRPRTPDGLPRSVVATDIAPNAEAALRKFVETAWPALKRLGLSPAASQSNLKFTAALAQAVAEAVQENGPERIDFKQKLYRQLDELLPPDAIIASSSSGLKMSEIQSGAASHPERCVIAHPFNPPHLIPLVEIFGGTKTSEATIRRAAEFYTSIGQRTVRLNKEMPGHVANRLQAALAREVPTASSAPPTSTPPCAGARACGGALWAT